MHDRIVFELYTQTRRLCKTKTLNTCVCVHKQNLHRTGLTHEFVGKYRLTQQTISRENVVVFNYGPAVASMLFDTHVRAPPERLSDPSRTLAIPHPRATRACSWTPHIARRWRTTSSFDTFECAVSRQTLHVLKIMCERITFRADARNVFECFRRSATSWILPIPMRVVQ